MTTKTTKTTKNPLTPKPLDEETSALVLAELLVLGDVKESEIAFISGTDRALSYRQIAITFRIADVLGIPDAFEIAPRFAEVFGDARRACKAVRP